MIISKAIRYFAERLGIKTTGTGISDAIVDLADNFPFGKRVEEKVVLSPQSLKDTTANYGIYDKQIATSLSFEVGKSYRVVFNDEEYDLIARSSNNNTVVLSPDENFNYTNPPTVAEGTFGLFSMNNNVYIMWHPHIGQTITIAIYEEIETITTLPAEFLPEEIQRVGDDVELTSPNGTKYKLSVADDGTLSAVTV